MHFKGKYSEKELDFRQAKIASAEQIRYDENGKAIIEMEIRDTEKFYSPYSVDGYELMNSDVSDFLQNSNNYIPMKYDIDIHIYTQKPATEERTTKIKNTIARYYAEEIVDLNLELKKSRTYAILCFLAGLAIMLAYTYIPSLSNIPILGKLLDISSWVFIWETVYNLTFNMSSKAIYRKRCLRLISADVILYQRQPKNKDVILSTSSTAKPAPKVLDGKTLTQNTEAKDINSTTKNNNK